MKAKEETDILIQGDQQFSYVTLTKRPPISLLFQVIIGGGLFF